jgi:septal ring factor EnvC (AmiA/AmiB activator)
MIEPARHDGSDSITRIGAQPIALAAVTLLALLAAFAGIGLWRAYASTPSEQGRWEQGRAVIARQLQARAAQASEELVAKTRGLEMTQEESIDQLQMLQDQMQQMKKLLAAQQADTKRLSDQVAGLVEAIDGLRHSSASAQNSEPSSPPPARHRVFRIRAHTIATQKPAKSGGGPTPAPPGGWPTPAPSGG